MVSAEKKSKKKPKAEELPVESVSEDTNTAPNSAALSKAKKQSSTQKARSHSKRLQDLAAKFDQSRSYSIADAVKLAKETATTKFTGSIEAHLIVTQKGLRGFIAFPHNTGRQIQLLVFGEVNDGQGITSGDDEVIEKIANGKLTPGKDFNLVIATPSYMPKLARVAKILGPKGLMPNPKSGTLTDKPEKAVKDLLNGQVEYKTEQNAPLIHLSIGKANTDLDKLVDNTNALIAAIGQNKIQRLTINATMGPSIKIKIQ